MVKKKSEKILVISAIFFTFTCLILGCYFLGLPVPAAEVCLVWREACVCCQTQLLAGRLQQIWTAVRRAGENHQRHVDRCSPLHVYVRPRLNAMPVCDI